MYQHVPQTYLKCTQNVPIKGTLDYRNLSIVSITISHCL